MARNVIQFSLNFAFESVDERGSAWTYCNYKWHMNSILKLIVPCRVVRQIYRSIFPAIPVVLHPIPRRVSCNSVGMMAQRSITSFFKVSPPKPVVKEEKVEEDKVNGEETVGSPAKNGKVKVIKLFHYYSYYNVLDKTAKNHKIVSYDSLMFCSVYNVLQKFWHDKKWL